MAVNLFEQMYRSQASELERVMELLKEAHEIIVEYAPGHDVWLDKAYGALRDYHDGLPINTGGTR